MSRDRVRFRIRMLVFGVLALGSVAGAAAEVTIEDWTSYPAGATGLPAGWQAQNWGTPHYDKLTIVDDGRRHALLLRSANDSSTLSKDIRHRVRLKETPLLEWEWKVLRLPTGGDACRKSRDDEAGQIFVVWPRFPEAVRSRIIGYVWDTTQPVGTVCKSEKTGTVTYVVVRSGASELNRWVTETRNVAEDFERIYGDTPDDPSVISISIDSNDTNSASEAMIGAIRFKSR